MNNTELRNNLSEEAFLRDFGYRVYIFNHYIADLFSVYFSLLCHRILLFLENFCLWRAWKCYCKSFLYVNLSLAKKLRSAKMLSYKLKMSHKHKMSSLWHWKKNLKSQHSIFIANDSSHLLAFAARISMFSVSTNRLFQLCWFPAVPVNSPSGWYGRATFLAHLHADNTLPPSSFGIML